MCKQLSKQSMCLVDNWCNDVMVWLGSLEIVTIKPIKI